MAISARRLALGAAGLVAGACALAASGRSGRQVHAPDPDTAIDAHALAVPANARNSVAALAATLTGPARGEREKARAIYCWIATNIGYASKEALPDAQSDSSAEAVLKRGTAVCAGFSDLFTALAHAAGLEAESINGYAKGVGYRAGGRISGPTNHAWNAVKIDGEWRLVDCTWGAGSVENGVYVKRFSAFYFLTPPRAFAWLHFPTDPRWQLLDAPMTLAEFEDLPVVRVPFFEYGLSLPSHTSARITPTTSHVRIRVDAPRDVLVIAGSRCGSGAGFPQSLPVRSRGGRHWITVDAARNQDCFVGVFATRASERDHNTLDYHWAVEYRLTALRVVE